MTKKEWANYCKEQRVLVLAKLQTETLETLTKHGRGVELEQMCIYCGLSEYGTSKAKALRLLNWKDRQAQ